MNIKKILFSITMLALGYGHNALADLKPGGLLVEPMAFYELASTNTNWPAPFSNSTGTANGFGVGAKLGFHISEVIFAGLDGRYAMPTFTDSSNNLSSSASRFDYGLTAGLQMPVVGVRVFAGWIIGSELDPSASGATDIKYTGGSGYRVGAGFRVSALSLNLEYQSLRYANTVVERAGPFAIGTLSNANMTDNAWILSVSSPLQL